MAGPADAFQKAAPLPIRRVKFTAT